jgi:hypothetical protein
MQLCEAAQCRESRQIRRIDVGSDQIEDLQAEIAGRKVVDVADPLVALRQHYAAAYPQRPLGYLAVNGLGAQGRDPQKSREGEWNGKTDDTAPSVTELNGYAQKFHGVPGAASKRGTDDLPLTLTKERLG